MEVRPFSGHRHQPGKASPQGVPGRSTGPGKDTAGRSECGSDRTGRLAAPGHKIYPYLLRNLPVTKPDQVWATDISYIPMQKGFVYLVAVVDWFSRRVPTWRVSISMEAEFCIEGWR